jgi:succinate dehydrogenase / fumarate reductase flavoprotein subunit
LADGYFVIPYTIGDYLATVPYQKVSTDRPEFKQALSDVKANIDRILSSKGNKTPDQIHIELGEIMLDKCGMSRTREGLTEAIKKIQGLKEEFKNNLKTIGTNEELNITLEKALRVEDFLELGELMCLDAMEREESCGGHFREEHQTPDGEAKRDDENFSYVAAWEYTGFGNKHNLHKEELVFENVKLTQRSYK